MHSAQTQSSQARSLRSGKLPYVAICAGGFLVAHVIGLVQALNNAKDDGISIAVGDAWFILVEAAYSAFLAYMLLGLYRKRITEPHLHDCILIVFGVLLPIFNLTGSLHLPGFSSSRSWMPFYAANISLAVAGGMPPAHTLLAWILATPCMIVISFLSQCKDPAQPRGHLCVATGPMMMMAADSSAMEGGVLHDHRYPAVPPSGPSCLNSLGGCSASSFAVHIATSGTFLALVSFASAFGTLLAVVKYKSSLAAMEQDASGTSGEGQAAALSNDAPSPDRHPPFRPPLESFGIRWGPNSWVWKVGPAVISTASYIDVSAMILVITIPICAILFARICMARFINKANSACHISADGLSIAMVSCVLLGRESCNLDMETYKKLFRNLHEAQLQASRAIFSYVAPSAAARIDHVRRQVADGSLSAGGEAGAVEEDEIQCLELLGKGSYGVVNKGLWRGTLVAVKSIFLPANQSGDERKEHMAIMEVAISSALSHPNIVQTFTYCFRSIQSIAIPTGNRKDILAPPAGTRPQGESDVHTLELRLVLEFCDAGTLRQALDRGAFLLPGGRINYRAVLDTAADICKGMMQLHALNIVHSDLKASNVLLKSSASEERRFIAKVADFGLSFNLDATATHASEMSGGTLTHLSPEALLEGHKSKAADVYAFGITLFELYTSDKAFRGIPRVILGHGITQGARPEFPLNAPKDYVALANRCWYPSPSSRPSFKEVLGAIMELRSACGGHTERLQRYNKGSGLSFITLPSRLHPISSPATILSMLAQLSVDRINHTDLSLASHPPSASLPTAQSIKSFHHSNKDRPPSAKGSAAKVSPSLEEALAKHS